MPDATLYELLVELRNLRLAVTFLAGLLVLVGLLLWWLPVPDDWPKRQRKGQRPDDLRERLFGRSVVSTEGSEGADGTTPSDRGDAESEPGRPGDGAGDVPSVVVPERPAGQAARPIDIWAEGSPGDAPPPPTD